MTNRITAILSISSSTASKTARETRFPPTPPPSKSITPPIRSARTGTTSSSVHPSVGTGTGTASAATPSRRRRASITTSKPATSRTAAAISATAPTTPQAMSPSPRHGASRDIRYFPSAPTSMSCATARHSISSFRPLTAPSIPTPSSRLVAKPTS